MKASTIKWHIARAKATPLANQRLARFCERNKVESFNSAPHPQIGRDEWFFEITYKFSNNGFIKAQLLAGSATRGYSVADHFEVMDYSVGSAV